MNVWRLRRKLHVSWLIAVMCAAIFVGVFGAQYLRFSMFSSIFCLIIAIILIFIGLWRRYLYLIPILIIGGLLFGLWHGSISQDELAQFKPLYGKSIAIEGRVKDDVDTGASGQAIVRLDSLNMGKKSLPGVLWVTTDVYDIKRGDRLLISGKLTPGFGNFAGVMYRANVKKIIHPQPGDTARVIRDWFADAVRRVIPEPESSLGVGYLVGQRRSLPADLAEALQIAGLTHIVVASGYNLTILVRLTRRLFARVSKYMAVLSAVAMIISFIAVTGLSPSMSRAGLVTGLSLAAWYYGRKFHPIVLLFLAIAITVMFNPSYAWGDLGWQLSFAAFAGVMIVAPLLQRYFFGDSKPGVVRQILGETISAQLVTAPILIMSFGQLSNVAIISNLLILPFVPLTMLLTFVAGVGSLMLPSLAIFIALPATWLLKYMVAVTKYLASLPWAMSEVNLAWWIVIICYVMIVAACVYMWRATKLDLRDTNLVE